MADRISKLHRSWVMSRVRGKNTQPERTVRSLLHRLGYRFTVNGPRNRSLPGKPDIVLPGRRTVVLVHGCFWHRHPGCRLATTPKSNAAYWQLKFERNVARDRENKTALQEAGWRVIVVWECELRDPEGVAARLIAELPRAPCQDEPETLEDERLVAEARAAYGRARKRSGGQRTPGRRRGRARGG